MRRDFTEKIREGHQAFSVRLVTYLGLQAMFTATQRLPVAQPFLAVELFIQRCGWPDIPKHCPSMRRQVTPQIISNPYTLGAFGF